MCVSQKGYPHGCGGLPRCEPLGAACTQIHVTFSPRRNKKHEEKHVQLTGKGHKIRYAIEIKSDKLFATLNSFWNERDINQ